MIPEFGRPRQEDLRKLEALLGYMIKFRSQKHIATLFPTPKGLEAVKLSPSPCAPNNKLYSQLEQRIKKEKSM